MTVTAAAGSSVDGVIEADCREEDVIVTPGERVRLYREEDGEECPLRLVADGEELHALRIRDYEAPDLTVWEDGDVEALEVE